MTGIPRAGLLGNAGGTAGTASGDVGYAADDEAAGRAVTAGPIAGLGKAPP